ncbi:hypothetical protein KY327_02840 [Candidatus Woesearchaeota archaeon]|nr:hypothetical protein [Candidatus Woesearchaeota archaeon]
MTLNESIDEEHGTITITGGAEEVRRFAHCLEETVMKGRLKESLETTIEEVDAGGSYEGALDLSARQRMYYRTGTLLFMPNATDKKEYFPLIKESYTRAKERYEGGTHEDS